MPTDSRRRELPAQVVLKYNFCVALENVDKSRVSRSRSPRSLRGSPHRDAARPTQFRHDRQPYRCAAAARGPLSLPIARTRPYLRASAARCLQPNVYLRLTWAWLMLPKCSGCFLLVPEEYMPPGAASREQQQQQRACASTARQQPIRRWDVSSDRIWRRTPLRWTPGSAGWRSPHVCTEMRLSMCRMCRGSTALAVALR